MDLDSLERILTLIAMVVYFLWPAIEKALKKSRGQKQQAPQQQSESGAPKQPSPPRAPQPKSRQRIPRPRQLPPPKRPPSRRRPAEPPPLSPAAARDYAAALDRAAFASLVRATNVLAQIEGDQRMAALAQSLQTDVVERAAEISNLLQYTREPSQLQRIAAALEGIKNLLADIELQVTQSVMPKKPPSPAPRIPRHVGSMRVQLRTSLAKKESIIEATALGAALARRRTAC